ncbi:hypothetical protein RchiOBHm_Chr1g0345311 [Rosa chinensis]|uniref:Uncharacterized protein n=1 Tax=Rosa chinensis TaxID=74649 RepID=A0A2P6SER7_ROSCH|nr:hypothetical protein RchiOBHm_Chr1g0345311 [Rosa chinensis]
MTKPLVFVTRKSCDQEFVNWLTWCMLFGTKEVDHLPWNGYMKRIWRMLCLSSLTC